MPENFRRFWVPITNPEERSRDLIRLPQMGSERSTRFDYLLSRFYPLPEVTALARNLRRALPERRRRRFSAELQPPGLLAFNKAAMARLPAHSAKHIDQKLP